LKVFGACSRLPPPKFFVFGIQLEECKSTVPEKVFDIFLLIFSKMAAKGMDGDRKVVSIDEDVSLDRKVNPGIRDYLTNRINPISKVRMRRS